MTTFTPNLLIASNVARERNYQASGRISITSLTMEQNQQLEYAFCMNSRPGGLKKAKLAVKLGGNVHDCGIIHLWFAIRRRLEICLGPKRLVSAKYQTIRSCMKEGKSFEEIRRIELMFDERTVKLKKGLMNLHYPPEVVQKIMRLELGLYVQGTGEIGLHERLLHTLESTRKAMGRNVNNTTCGFASPDKMELRRYRRLVEFRCKMKTRNMHGRNRNSRRLTMGSRTDDLVPKESCSPQEAYGYGSISGNTVKMNQTKRHSLTNPLNEDVPSPLMDTVDDAALDVDLASAGPSPANASEDSFQSHFMIQKGVITAGGFDDMCRSRNPSIPTINVQLITPETTPEDYHNRITPRLSLPGSDFDNVFNTLNPGSLEPSTLHVDDKSLTRERRKSIEKVTEWMTQNPESPPGTESIFEQSSKTATTNTAATHPDGLDWEGNTALERGTLQTRETSTQRAPFTCSITAPPVQQFHVRLNSHDCSPQEGSIPKGSSGQSHVRGMNPESNLSPQFALHKPGIKGSKETEDHSLHSDSEMFDESLYSVWSDSAASGVDLSLFLSQKALQSLSSQFMGRFRHYKQTHGIQDCTTSPDSSSKSNANKPNVGRTGQSTSNKTRTVKRSGTVKRKRGEDDDGDGRRRNHRRSPSSQSKPDLTDYKMERTFACPFCKWKPLTYSSCRGYTLKEISRVKMHLNRIHQVPIHCDRCYQVFKTEEEKRVHSRSVNCTILPERTFEGMTGDMVKLVHRRVDARKAKAEQWYDIFKILFPGEPLPESPYIDEVLSRELLALQDFMMQEWSKVSDRLISQHLPAPLHGQGPLVRHFANFLFEHAVDDIFQRFESTRGPNSRSPDSGYLDAQQPVSTLGNIDEAALMIGDNPLSISTNALSQIDTVSGTYAGSAPDPSGSGQMSPYTTPTTSVQLGDPSTDWLNFMPGNAPSFLDNNWIPPKF